MRSSSIRIRWRNSSGFSCNTPSFPERRARRPASGGGRDAPSTPRIIASLRNHDQIRQLHDPNLTRDLRHLTVRPAGHCCWCGAAPCGRGDATCGRRDEQHDGACRRGGRTGCPSGRRRGSASVQAAEVGLRQCRSRRHLAFFRAPSQRNRIDVMTTVWYSRAEPSRAEPSRAEPSRAEPSRAEPSRAEPSRAEPSRAEPSRAEPSRAEPSRAEPSRAEPSRAEPSRAEPSRAEPSNRRQAGRAHRLPQPG